MLRPISGEDSEPRAACIPAWDAIFPTQKQRASEYWLVTQPDHAALSGDIARALGLPLIPNLSPEVVAAIAAHDDGWAPFDANIAVVNGKPLSFVDFGPPDFLRAWGASIQRAEAIAAIGGAIVSEHFRRLAQSRLEWGIDGPENRALLINFVDDERARQEWLLGSQSRQEFEFLTDVLQFCDVLSLYLCCGAAQDIEFPQRFGPEPIRLHREAHRSGDMAGVCCFTPSPFSTGGISLAVIARHFSAEHATGMITLPFVLY